MHFTYCKWLSGRFGAKTVLGERLICRCYLMNMLESMLPGFMESFAEIT
jgi:hypothetical protein